MRLLIGSDGPSSLGRQADVRAWTQRLLWFAQNGDAIVMMDEPDPTFIDHVTSLTGVDRSSLRFHIMPSRWIGGNFDAWSLLDKDFQTALMADTSEATEVLALWPSQEVGWLVKSIGLEQKLPGAAFWREGGGALANSKTVFRALAAGAGVATPPGGVCRSIDDAYRLSGYLLQQSPAFMVKRSYGGGGQGNEIVFREQLAVSHSGHVSAEAVAATPEDLHAYWERRWAWASCHGAHPVVVETFIPDARTLYVEVLCGPESIGDGNVGELKFEDGRIALEIFPAQDVPKSVLDELHRGGRQLAQAYRAAGYCGFLSLDSVVTAGGCVLFTEANARFTGSTHLYDQIARRVARISDVPDRVVVQTLTPSGWKLDSLEQLFAMLNRERLTFDPKLRQGILAVTPIVHGTGQVVLATIAKSEAAAVELVSFLHQSDPQFGANRRV